MKVALVSSYVPFVLGGARNIVDWVIPHLQSAGHEVEVVWIPFVEDSTALHSQLSAFRGIDLTGHADIVVCFRPPAYLVRHPRKVLWFIHHLRSYYDLWGTPYSSVQDTALTRSYRDGIRRMDRRAFAECSRIFTNSSVVSERLRRFNGVNSEVLYPPLQNPDLYRNSGDSDTIVYVSRVERHKRHHLLVEALGLTRTQVTLRFAGVSTDSEYVRQMRARSRELGVDRRLVIDDRWVSDEEKTEILSTSLATAYLPHDEDSYGYPTLEAAHSRKAVLTTSDSGGVLEFVDDRVGWVVEPDPSEIAAAMDSAFTRRKETSARGDRARNRIDELGISWESVVDRLLS